MKSINKPLGINKDKGEVKVEFSGKNMTPYGGFGLFRKFVRKLGIEKVLDKVSSNNIPEGKYTVGRKVMSLVHGLVCGLERPSDTELLKRDKVFQSVVGYEDYPEQSTFSRFLKAFSVEEAKQIGDKGVQTLLRVRNNFRGYFKLTFDLDSHVKTVYGNQQRAKVGYNPKKPGRKAIIPCFASSGRPGIFSWVDFGPGIPIVVPEP
ncbi:MAG: transposase [Chloroflexi bacterium]|nr:transposase [Chloroflexota bacterium]